MTSTSIKRPPPRSLNAGIGRPLNRTPSQAVQQPPRSVPYQSSINPIHNLVSTGAESKPVVKRQKLDASNKFAAGFLGIPVQEESAAFTEKTFQQELSRSRLVVPEGELESIKKEANEEELKSPPFPKRPEKPIFKRPTIVVGYSKAISKEEVQSKPYSLEVPKSAPQYGNNAPADFFPWIGSHPEDTLNEQTTKSGYYDRAQIVNESNTARQLVWSNLKHRSGLQVLSSLFVSALDQRQLHGTITSSCTFKPPPRVTLTDTKREAWLRDLGSPAIPLRRLSRTIPHGIRGKALLDHCLSKHISTWRAVWLAKCVGANEIRAFKRKGTSGAFAVGGEVKWLRDWTANVEQFIEILLEACGTSEWKTRMTYGLRLVAHLHSEHLLDHEHFLDWILTSLHASDVDRIPVWLLTVQIDWKEIWRYRYRGRRLAETMLNHFCTVSKPGILPAYRPIQENLGNFLKSSIIRYPDCFVLPNCWTKYSSVLKSCSDERDRDFSDHIDRLSDRNGRLIRDPGVYDSGMNRTPRQNIIDILDKSSLKYNFEHMSDACLKTTNDRFSIVTTVLEWSTTQYRDRTDRLYLGVRLLRQWNRSGIQLETPILTLLGDFDTTTGYAKTNVCRLIAELARSQHFSISKYLQWLVARGLQGSVNPAHQGHHLSSMLLLELPLCNLPPHIRNLRNILLKEINRSVLEEQEIIAAVKSKLVAMLPDLLNYSDSLLSNSIVVDSLASLRGTVKSEISCWIRQSIVSRVRSGDNVRPIGQTEKPGSTSLTVSEFNIVHRVLEELEEFPMLADVLWLASETDNVSLLSAVANIINRQFDIFYAIGAVNDIFQKLQSNSVKSLYHTPLSIPFLLLLVDLGERLPSAKQELRKLRKEIALCESKPVMAACSPVSDHVVEVLQSAESTFVEEMELLLSSGNSMDRQTLSRIFTTITKRIEKAWDDSSHSTVGFYSLLTRLRIFNKKAFDSLIQGWLEATLSMKTRPRLLTIVMPLVCTAVMRLQAFVDRTAMYLSIVDEPALCSKLSVEILSLLAPQPLDEDGSGFNRTYRYYNAIQDVLRECPSSLTFIIATVLSPGAHQLQPSKCNACQLISTSSFLSMTQSILLHHEPATVEFQGCIASISPHESISGLPNRLLSLASKTNSIQPVIRHEIRRILDTVNDFNIVFCRLKLLTILNSRKDRLQDNELSAPNMITMLIQELLSSANSQPSAWVSLVAKLPHHHALLFHDQATSLLLASLTRDEPTITDAIGIAIQPACVGSSLISMIDATERQIPDDGPALMLTKLKDNLSGLQLEVMSSIPPTRDSKVVSATGTEKQMDIIWLRVNIIIRLIVIHQNKLRQPNVPSTVLPQILVDLSLLYVNPALNSNPAIATDIFDTIAVLSDHLSVEARSLCIRAIRDQHQLRDPRLQFLFGYSEHAESDGLHLVMNTLSSSPISAANNNINHVSKHSATTSMLFPLRSWEMVQDATPVVGENDTSLSLSLFGARKAIP